MFSDEFMRFLINYQRPEESKKTEDVKSIKLSGGGRKLATILLTVKK